MGSEMCIRDRTINAPMLPESALQSDPDGTFVYVVDSENRAQRQSIETGIVTPDGIAIVAGLNGDERVVLRAGAFLTPGEVVLPKLQENWAQ